MNRNNGFTIVEMLVVVGVIGILLGVATIGLLNNAKRSSKDSTLATAESAKIRLGAYFADNSRYPATQGDAAAYLTSKDAKIGTAFADTNIYTYAATAIDGGVCTSAGVVRCEKYTITVNANKAWGGQVSDNVILKP